MCVYASVCACVCLYVRMRVCEYLSGMLPRIIEALMVEILKILNVQCTMPEKMTFEKVDLSGIVPQD